MIDLRTQLQTEMLNVIETTKAERDNIIKNRDTVTKHELDITKTIISANKNIVSAAIVSKSLLDIK